MSFSSVFDLKILTIEVDSKRNGGFRAQDASLDILMLRMKS